MAERSGDLRVLSLTPHTDTLAGVSRAGSVIAVPAYWAADLTAKIKSRSSNSDQP